MQKKVLTESDYPKWGQLQLYKLNTTGQWVSYGMSYESGLDTLFLKNTKSLKIFAFPLGKRADFITQDWFAYYTTEGLHLMNLKTGKQEIVPHASQYSYTPKVKRLLILVKESKYESTLHIRELSGRIQEQITGVTEFLVDPSEKIILYAASIQEQNCMNILELSENNRKTTICNSLGTFSNLTWHIESKAVAFMQNNPDTGTLDNTISYYSLINKKLYNYTQSDMQKSLGDTLFISNPGRKLRISDDLEKVFFVVKSKPIPKNSTQNSNVQIWNGNAKWVYPMEEKQKPFQGSYLTAWFPLKNQGKLLSSSSLPKILLNGDQKYALLSNEKQYEPQFAYESPRDFYLLNISTGKSKLLLKKHSGYISYTISSPRGRYITYFKEKNWWIYDITKNTHTNITGNIGQPFFHNEKEHPNNISAYPALGWTKHDKEIILCDQYDLWAITPDGSSARRLTKGREMQTKFRLAGYSSMFTGKENYDGRIDEIIDLKIGLLLEASNKLGGSGYYRLTSDSNEKIIFSTNTALDQLMQSDKGNTFVYREQDYDLSPRAMLGVKGEKSSKIVYQSNPQQKQFYWGKSKLIPYQNSKGQALQAILYYPAKYDSLKKYPMVVYIYEKLSQHLNKYINPSQYIGDGQFNISTFTTQDYFVLAPDISYEIGNVGVSATDCVVSATREVIAKELIFPNKIGITGHSFGGYETDFIITQTNLFAAAVAGSAATDMSSLYLTIGWNNGRPDMWRFENQQWRMGKSLFDDQAGYNRNSPILHADNITTPLLSWTGDNDMQVNWNQSIEFYLALRRLNKQHIMLLYPKEGHTLEVKQNQKDLYVRIHEWFDYHLKDSPAPSWIAEGIK